MLIEVSSAFIYRYGIRCQIGDIYMLIRIIHIQRSVRRKPKQHAEKQARKIRQRSEVKRALLPCRARKVFAADIDMSREHC